MQAERGKGSGLDLVREVWSRRKWLAIAAFAVPFTAVVSLAMFLPNIYRATATVLVERQQMAEAFVKPAVTSQLETRLHTISEQILSRSRLEELIRQFDLYPEVRRRAAPEALVERMRREIKLEPKEIQEPGGRGVTIAFALSYRGRNPETVARVTNTLASFYIGEDAKGRERLATGTAEFLRRQLDEAKQRLDEQERRVGGFKERYLAELPQQRDVNLAMMERLNSQLRLNSDQQLRAMERRETLLRQLGDAESYVPLAPPPPGVPESPGVRLARLRNELRELRARYSEKYPDVVRLKVEIAALERELAEKPEGTQEQSGAGARPSPGSRLKQALSEAEAELKRLKTEEATLRQAIPRYEWRVENAPRREQELKELSRDYESTKDLYESLRKRYEEAQMAESAEQGRKAAQFQILDPAIPPKDAVAPNRLGLLLIGLVLSLGMAAGAAVVAEHVDTSFHSVDDLRSFTRVPVLASIPKIVADSDIAWRLRWFELGAVAVVAALGLVVSASFYIAHGNDQLVSLLSRGRF